MSRTSKAPAGGPRRRWLRRLALGLAVSLLSAAGLAGAGLAILSRVVEAEAYRQQLVSFVEARSGLALSLDGPLKLTWLPRPRLHTGSLRLANARGFGEQPMIEAVGAELELRWWPMIWRRQLVPARVILHGPELRLQRLANGRANWDDLLKPRPGGGPPALALAAVAGLVVVDGRVSWDDRRYDRHWRLERFGFTGAVLRPHRPTPVRGTAAWRGTPDAPLRPVEWQARLVLEPDARRLLLRPFRASLGERPRLRLDVPEVEYRYDLQRLDITKLQFQVQGLPARTEGRLPTVRLDLRRQRLTVPRVELYLDGVPINGSIHGTHLFRRPHFYGRIFTRLFDLRRLLASHGLSLRLGDDQALTRFSLHAVYERAPGLLRLQEIKAIVDDATLGGMLEADGWRLGKLQGSLRIKDLDLDRYLGPARLEQVQAGGWVVPGASLLWYPSAWMGTRRLGLRLQLERVTLGGLRTDSLQFQLQDRGGRLEVVGLRGRLYGGRLEGRMRLDYGEDPPRLASTQRLTGVALGALFTDAGLGEWLQGRGDLAVQLEAEGRDGPALLETARGEMRVRLGRGRLAGLDLVALLEAAARRFQEHQSSTVTLDAAPGSFEFNRLAANVLFSQGVASNNDLAIHAVPLRVRGRGTADLLRRRLDYTLELAVPTLPKSHPAAAALAGLRGLTIPVRLRGSFEQPRYQVDVNVLLRRAVEEAVRQKRQ